MNRILLAVLMLSVSAAAWPQEKLVKACLSEVRSFEADIEGKRKLPEFRSPQGRQALSGADRWLNTARKHANSGESRQCVEAVKKGRAALGG